MNGYQLTRKWFDFAYNNSKVKPQHTALYCWCVELNNRLQWKESFGLPTDEAREYTGIGNRNTFYSALEDLKKWGFIKEIQPSINQSQSRIISLRLVENEQAGDKQSSSSNTSNDTIGKQSNNETLKTSNENFDLSGYGQMAYLVQRWLDYKKSINDKYKSQESLNMFFKKLTKYSNGNAQLAEDIIEESMANEWKGIFEPKNQKNNSANQDVPPGRTRQFHESFTFTPNQ